MADRKDNIENEDIVVWHTFGLTHNPRIEGESNYMRHVFSLG
jgi:Cu2+-containing amine oxidase